MSRQHQAGSVEVINRRPQTRTWHDLFDDLILSQDLPQAVTSWTTEIRRTLSNESQASLGAAITQIDALMTTAQARNDLRTYDAWTNVYNLLQEALVNLSQRVQTSQKPSKPHTRKGPTNSLGNGGSALEAKEGNLRRALLYGRLSSAGEAVW
ncbi:hypothetical protein BMF94_1307 [Rhodotorula taiwanensis]|uniref:Uncharacterized protein n=1 Tax=Rhodotorula taiwanensis TaxID=741276 RepID=A0A2S5BFZ0_9BASI|nr:hypothetical protein BMF94_1307 [Rhodotorula taiwanensis]